MNRGQKIIKICLLLSATFLVAGGCDIALPMRGRTFGTTDPALEGSRIVLLTDLDRDEPNLLPLEHVRLYALGATRGAISKEPTWFLTFL